MNRSWRTMLVLAVIVIVTLATATVSAVADTQVINTSLVSAAIVQGNSVSLHPAISADGGTIVFASTATNLVAGDTNGFGDVFAYDVATRTTTRISVATGGAEANGSSSVPAISADGNTITYESSATNLVAGDTNGFIDIFAYDVATATTTRISVATNGTQGNGASFDPAVSADGSTVTFDSVATNLVAGDTNGTYDVFTHDTATGSTTRISVATNRTEGNGASSVPAISADGNTITYQSDATNLVAGDSNGLVDVFAYDAATSTTTRISVASGGTQSNGASMYPAVSADGNIITYESGASNLVTGDTNAVFDVFAHDVATGTTTRISVATNGTQGNGTSDFPAISADGNTITYQSQATNLVVGDSNASVDVFAYEVATGTTTRISVATNGTQGNGTSDGPAPLSAGGNSVVFYSDATNLVPVDTNGTTDVFLHDVATGATTRISAMRSPAGGSSNPVISADGNTIVFPSSASNLVPGDTNGVVDVFAYDVPADTITRVSVATGGTEGNGESFHPAISADGSTISYASLASNLVAGDTNAALDVFAYDVATGTTTRISVATNGTEGNGTSDYPAVSADGSTIAFDSLASNLVSGDTNGAQDVFAHDIATGTTSRVSIATNGAQGNGDSATPVISGDGNSIVFYSGATNLVPGDTNGAYDVFAHDIATGTTSRVSVASDGTQGNGDTFFEAISGDGGTIAYASEATNLVPGDTNGTYDVFTHDVATGTTTRISVATGGTQGNGNSYAPAISADGSTIAYHSDAPNLVPGDSNGANDVFAWDRSTGTTTRVSVGTGGTQGNAASNDPAVSADADTIAYVSLASNFAPGDTNSDFDTFLTRISRSPVAEDLSLSIPEDTPVGTALGTVAATDLDGDPLSFAITAGNGAGLFSIDTGGVLHLEGLLDFETTTSHSLTVTVSDGSLTDMAAVTINVVDVDPFTDTTSSVFENDIEWLAFTGITKGCNPPANDLFCPNDKVTRGQMAAFLHRALVNMIMQGPPVTFTDTSGSVFAADIQWLGNTGITKGCNPPANDMFCPNDVVTRGQMAAFLVRALFLTDDGGGNLFTDDNGSVFESDIDKLATAGVTKGCNPPINDHYCPNDAVTRGQMAAFLHRALG